MAAGWKDKYPAKVEAEVARAELYRLRDKYGRPASAEEVLAENSVPGTPLYDACEWDDGVAAHQHRLNQIRGVQRNLVYIDDTDRSKVIREFAAVKLAIEQNGKEETVTLYESVHVIKDNPDLRRQLLASVAKELNSLLNKYDDLEEFFGVKHEIQKLTQDLRQQAGSRAPKNNGDSPPIQPNT